MTMEELSLNYKELQETVEQLLPEYRDISVKALVELLASGEGFGDFFRTAGAWLLQCVTFPAEQAMELLLLILFGALFANVAKAFFKSGASHIGFLCVYLLMTLHIISSFRTSLGIVEEGLANLCQFVTVLLPTYCVSIAFVTGSFTATGYYQGTAFLITAFTWLTGVVLLPLSKMYMLIAFASCMQKEPVFGRLMGLLLSVFSWVRRTVFGIVMAFGALQAILLPAIDQLKKNTLVKSAAVIPGVGSLVKGAWETVMGAGIVLKNAVGIGGVLLIFLIAAVPLCHLGLQYLLYRVLAAVTEPIAQDRTAELLVQAGTAQKLLFETLLLGILLFVLLLVIMTRITV